MIDIFAAIAIILCGTGTKPTPIDPNAEPYCFDWREHGWNTPNEQEDPVALGIIARENHNRALRALRAARRRRTEAIYPQHELQGVNWDQGLDYE